MENANATYTVTSEPAVEPITLNELKDRLRITTCDFDEELSDMLIAGRQQVEYDAKVRLITQTVQLKLDQFPGGPEIEIRTLPVQSVSSVQYVDENQTTQTLSSSLYNVDTSRKPPRIVLLENEDWEDTEQQWPGAVTVTFVAGYGAAAADVPVHARLAIVEWVKMHWGDCSGDIDKYARLLSKVAWSGYWVGR